MAVVAGHLHAVQEPGPVPRACLLLAREWREPGILVAGIFSEASQVCIKGFCGVHAGEWGAVDRLAGFGRGFAGDENFPGKG